MSFSKRLVLVRGSLSQREIARRLKVHFNTIANYEQGERMPDVKFIQKFCEEFEIEAEWLLYGRGPMYSADVGKPDIKDSVNEEAMKRTIEAVETVLEEKELRPPPHKKAALIMLVYDDIVNGNFKNESDIKKKVAKYYKAIR